MYVCQRKKDKCSITTVRNEVVLQLSTHRRQTQSTVLSSVTLHTYRGQFNWQNLVFKNMHEAGETNLFSNEIACYN